MLTKQSCYLRFLLVWLSVGGTPVTVVGVPDENSMEGVTLLIVLVELTGVWLGRT